jgi:hypothetical protein
MKKIFMIATIFAMFILFSATQIAADSFMSPEPFEIISNDGLMVFKWHPGSQENWWQGTAKGEVYRNGELVYTVENLLIMGESKLNFFFSKDFQHFMYKPTTGDEFALQFYSNGELKKTYYINDLVSDMDRVSYSVTMAMWLRSFPDTRSAFDHIIERDILRIMTVEGIIYEFDLTTGAILNSNQYETPPSSWAQRHVHEAIYYDLVPLNLRSNYSQATTRSEFTALAVAVYEKIKGEITGRATFTDTDDINVQKAAYVGIVNGVGNNRFDPDGTLTREQAAVMLSNLANALGQPLPLWLMGLHPSALITDYETISSWAVDYVAQIYQAEIMSGVGDNRFAPRQPYTREQGIVTILRVYEYVRDLNISSGVEVSSQCYHYESGSVEIISNGMKFEPYESFIHAGTQYPIGMISASGVHAPLEELFETLSEIQYGDDFQIIINGEYAYNVRYNLYNNNFESIFIGADNLPISSAETGIYLLVVSVFWTSHEYHASRTFDHSVEVTDDGVSLYTVIEYIFKVRK